MKERGNYILKWINKWGKQKLNKRDGKDDREWMKDNEKRIIKRTLKEK